MTNEAMTATSYADRVLREAMLGATSGLDPEQARAVVADTLAGLAKMAASLKAAEYRPEDAEKTARSMAHAMKSADGLVRLMEFASGRPDSRADVGTDWLRGLTDEQLALVSSWVDATAQREAPDAAPGRRGA